jgi:uncharacterized membrane protein
MTKTPAQEREFRDRYLKRVFGTRKQRAARWAYLVRELGKKQMKILSNEGLARRERYLSEDA